MQQFMMAYDLPSGDSDARLALLQYGMQIANDEGATSDQFSVSVVLKPVNTLEPMVSSAHSVV